MIEKKRAIAIMVAISVVICILISFYFNNKRGDSSEQLLKQSATAGFDIGAGNPGTVTGTGTLTGTVTVTGTEPFEDSVKVEGMDFEVHGNTPEYDMNAAMYVNGSGSPSLRLEYYLEGSSNIREIDSMQIPEIEGMAGKNATESQTAINAASIRILLNTIYSKVYIFVMNYKASSNALYSFTLKENKLELVFRDDGSYSSFAFNSNQQYLAYNCDNPPWDNSLPESRLFEVLDCSKDRYVVKGSRTNMSKMIGAPEEQDVIRNYIFYGWQGQDTAILQAELKKTDKTVFEGKVLYDIKNDQIMNLDGSSFNIENDDTDGAAAPPDGNGEQAVSAAETPSSMKDAEVDLYGTIAESSALKVLKDFYLKLASEGTWKDAMTLLDDNFVLKLELFKQYGITELKKSDINSEDASLFSSLLMTAKYDMLEKEENNGKVAVISYYHLLGENGATQLRQLMKARIEYKSGKWIIAYIEDISTEVN